MLAWASLACDLEFRSRSQLLQLVDLAECLQYPRRFEVQDIVFFSRYWNHWSNMTSSRQRATSFVKHVLSLGMHRLLVGSVSAASKAYNGFGSL